MGARPATGPNAARRGGIGIALVLLVVACAAPRSTLPVSSRMPSLAAEGTPRPTPTPSASVPPTTLAPSPSPVFDVVKDGDTVIAVGQLFRGENGPVKLCEQLIAFAMAAPSPPICAKYTTVDVAELDLDNIARQEGWADSYWVSEYVRVYGTWSERGIRAIRSEPAERPSPDTAPLVPCSTPEGGWPGDELTVSSENAKTRLVGVINSQPELYSGIWIASIGQTEENALVVGTVGDAYSEARELSEIYPYNLCVVGVDFSADELRRVERALAGKGPWQAQVAIGIDRVAVTTAVLTQSTADALAPYADTLVVDVTVTRAP